MWSHLCFKILTLSPPRLQMEESRLVGTPCLETTLRHPWAGTPWPPWCPAPGGQVQSSRGACCPQRHSRDVLPWVPTAWTGEEVWVSIAPLGCTSRVGQSSATVPVWFQTELLSVTMALSPYLGNTSHRNVTGCMHTQVSSSGYEIPHGGISGPYLVGSPS